MTDHLEIKASIEADDDGSVTGIAWPFGSADRVGDVIEPGAFITAKAPLPMLFGHDPNDPIGVWDDVSVDIEGLQVKGRLLIGDVLRAREVNALVKAKAVGGLSIGFITRKATARRGGGRNITALELAEISLVTIPSHPRARIAAKQGVEALRLAESLNRAALALRA